MSLLRIAFVVLATLTSPVLAQETESANAEAPRTRTLDDEQVAARLAAVTTDLLPTIWPERCNEDRTYRTKYLRKWQAIQSEHYLVFTNGPTQSCKRYATTLEDLYAYVRKALPFDDLDHLLIAYIFADPEDYYRFAARVTGYSDEQARGTAGHSAGDYYATYYDSPRSAVVYHEATHQIVSECLKVGGVGSWFQEGLAVYFEKKMTNARPQADAKVDLKHGNCYPLEQFLAIPSLLADEDGNGHRNYEHAGALMDFMINTKLEPVKGKFGAFLDAARASRGAGRGLEVSSALIRSVYGLSVTDFEALWREHLGIR